MGYTSGQPMPDSTLRDFENVPLKDDIDDYFALEVLPHVPDAWMDTSKDKVGYEISFTKYFYEYTPLRSTETIAAELLALDQKTENLLREIVKGSAL
jgi:type I restriction enzyme M protein